MARGKWLSSEEKESIMEMRAGGMTAAQIATKMERGVKSIQRVLNAKDEKPLQANEVTRTAPAGVPTNTLHVPEPAPTNAQVPHPLMANVMEMRAGGMTTAQIMSEMETAFQLTQHVPSNVVTPPETAPVLAGRQQDLSPHAGPLSPSPKIETASERVPVVDTKAALPPKSVKRPQAPRSNAKKSPPKAKVGKTQRSSAPTQVSPHQQSHVASQAQEPQQAVMAAAHHYPHASGHPTVSSLMASTYELQHPQSFGYAPAAQSDPAPPHNEPATYSSRLQQNRSVDGDVEMTSSYMEQLAQDSSSISREGGGEGMVNVIPDEDSDEDEEDKPTHNSIVTQQVATRQLCVRRPPRINDAIAASAPSNVDSHAVSSIATSQLTGNADQVEPQARSAPADEQTEMLRSFEAELESSQAQTQTQTPPASQIEPEPSVVKKRKIDASDVTKSAEDPINYAMALLARAVEDSNASRKAGLAEKRLALLFQRFQVDVQLLQLEQPCSGGATSWEL